MNNKNYKFFDYEIVIALSKQQLEEVKKDKKALINSKFKYIGDIELGKRGFHYYKSSALMKLNTNDFINQTVYEIEDTADTRILGNYSCCTSEFKIVKLLTIEEKKELIGNIKI